MNDSSILESKVEELGLMMILVDENDESSLDIVLEILEDVKKSASAIAELEPLTEAIKSFKSKRKETDSSKYCQELEVLHDNIKQFINTKDSSIFTISEEIKENNKEEVSVSSWGDDLSSYLDEEICQEFVATHLSDLNEFEANVLELDKTDLDTTHLISELKRYLHTLKGDSGSVGFGGIAKATHKIEDLVEEKGIKNLIDILIDFKEWVTDCINAYQEERSPKLNSDSYIKKLLSSKNENKNSTSLNETLAEKESVNSSSDESIPDALSEAENDSLEEYKLEGETDILMDFSTEADDQLNTVEEMLLGGELPGQDEVNAIFRAIHSIKGGSAYFNLRDVTRTSHILESVLDKARNNILEFDKRLSELVLSYVALTKDLLSAALNLEDPDSKMKTNPASEQFVLDVADYMFTIATGKKVEESRIKIEGSKSETTEIKVEETKNEEKKDEKVVATNETKKEANVNSPQTASSSLPKKKKVLKTFVKVDTNRLDTLIEYIGEMTITSSMLIKRCKDLLSDDETLMTTSQQFEQTTREIYNIGMSMRLVPIKGLFQKMSRLVWDTSKVLNKEINFVVEGEDTELDRSLIDKIADPLMHMVRNSIDHGIEAPDEREKIGKSRAGNVKLSAYYSGGSIHIQIKDDGKGLNADGILAKAIENNLISANHNLSEQDVFQLIFKPGFSTAETITETSGRGVGMDVVRKNIESMRGHIDIQSKVGEGSTFTIELPLTLAIMDGIETVVSNERFIIPTLSIIEFVKPTEEVLTTTMRDGETFLFRGEYLPVFRLDMAFGLSNRKRKLTESIILVIECNRELVALAVDEVIGKYSTVIKNLGEMFREVKGLAGCAIMADGDIGLILDPASTIKMARSNRVNSNNFIPNKMSKLKEEHLEEEFRDFKENGEKLLQ